MKRLLLLPHDNELGWTPYAWVVYIIPFAITPVVSPRFNNPAGWTMFSVATLAFLALYFRAYWARGRELVLISAAMLAFALAFWPIAYGAGAMFIYAAGAIGMLEPSKHAVRAVAFIAAIVVLEAWLLHRSWWHASWPFVFTIIVGAINIHFCQVGRANARLRLAHDEIEHLAKMAERERIARDLHDLLGHTLSVVILKSELASKLADRDVERAREEIRDVERISREALSQVRAAVSGYRSDGLENEVRHARSALASAGVALEADLAKTQLPPAHEAVLALAMREAVTNIVRHAGARRSRIRVDVSGSQCVLVVSDDGRGGNEPFGSGLSGMRERVEVLGGTMTRDGRGGTTLMVTLPLSGGQAILPVQETA